MFACTFCGKLKDDLKRYCSSKCKSAANYIRNKEKINKRNALYKLEHSDEEATRNRNYASRNIDKIRTYKSNYNNIHRDRLRLKSKEYYLNNKERARNYYIINREYGKLRDAEYYQQNKQYRAAYKRERRANNIYYRLASNLRTRLSNALKHNKVGSAIVDLGCTIEELKTHLESQFLPGMSWDNYGRNGWHIDHILPLQPKEAISLEEITARCHYKNLRPVWAEYNWSKGNRPDTKENLHAVTTEI